MTQQVIMKIAFLIFAGVFFYMQCPVAGGFCIVGALFA